MRRLVFLLPFIVLFVLLVGIDDIEPEPEQDLSLVSDDAEDDRGRLVVLIIDSLRRDTLEAPGVMPGLLEFAGHDDVAVIDVKSCAANFTYPCLQTMFEGRQSPFVAGLHNFTGRASDGQSVPSDLEAQQRNLGMISNISMVSLYGHHAAKTVDVEEWPMSHLERDLATFDVVEQWIDDDNLDDLFVHVLGTDKAAHHEQPGTEGYEEHFRKVDARSVELVSSLDLTRDHLLVTGDHGHDEQGHHTRETIALMAGPLWGELMDLVGVPEALDQTELIYFMSYAAGLDLPLHYEGRYFLTEQGVDLSAHEHAQAFVRGTEQALVDQGYEVGDLVEAIDAHRAELERRHERNLIRHLPLLALFFLWLVIIQSRFSGRLRIRQQWLVDLGLAAGCLLTLKLTSSSQELSLGLALVYTVAALGWAWHHKAMRFFCWAILILGATALIGLHVREWADFFHTRGGFVPGQPIFYGMLPLIGLALARIRYADLKRAPEGAMAFCLFSLPSGVYYYQFGQSMFWGFLLAAALVAVVVYTGRWRRSGGVPEGILKPNVMVPAALVMVSTVLLLMQESGGWEWDYFPTRWLQDLGTEPTVALFAALVIYLAWLVKSKVKQVMIVVYMGGAMAFSVGVGAMSLFEFVASHTVVLFIASWLAVADSPLRLAREDRSGQRAGLVLLGAMLAMGWFIAGGFFIHSIDFHFAFDYFGDLQRDRDIFAGVAAATLLKYGLPLCSLLLVYRLMRGPRAFRLAMDWLIFFISFGILALFTQIFFAAVGSTEKLYELAVAQLVFVFLILVMVAVFSLIVGVIDRGRH